MNYKYLLAAGCVLLLVFFFLRPDPERSLTSSIKVSERPDSTLVSIDRTPTKLHLGGKLRPRATALALDTIIDSDTVCVYIAPDSTIEIRLLPAPRIVQEWVKFIRRDSILYQTPTEFIERPWYESPMLVVVGAVLGFLVAMLL
jgi:hypothetical protein